VVPRDPNDVAGGVPAGSARVGALLRAFREQRLLTQEQLAVRAGVDVRTVRRLEARAHSRPRGGSLGRLVHALGLGPAERDALNAAMASTAGATHPAQLPASGSGFVGRSAELRLLDRLLTDKGDVHDRRSICVVTGTAGVGKSALALHWARRMAAYFPHGQLYVNLRGFDPSGRAMTTAEAVRGFLDALGVSGQQIPGDPHAQASHYRTLLAGRQVLVVLDNARDADQVRPLLPGTSSAVVIVTSRDHLTGLVAVEAARPLTLDLLSGAEARDLLIRRLGEDRTALEPRAVEQIVTACARLPLALVIAAARAERTGFPLATVAGELTATGRRLDALDTGDPASQLRAVFSWSFAALGPPAARLFRLLGLHPGPDIAVTAAASLAGVDVDGARPALAELARANLLTEHAGSRYAFHDLLRDYAASLNRSLDTDEERTAALRRLMDHYTHTAHAADRLLRPRRDPIDIPLAAPVRDSRRERLADEKEAMTWLASERLVLVAVLRHAVESGFPTHGWQLAWALDTFLNRQGRRHDLSEVWRAALHAAEDLGDPRGQAYAHRILARTDTELGHYADAHAHLHRAAELYAVAGDDTGQAHTRHNLAIVSARQGHPDQALHHAQRALALYRDAGDSRGQAVALNAVGWYHAQLGDPVRCISHCEQALTTFEQLDDRAGVAATWHSLGYAQHHLGHHAEAADCYRRALTFVRELRDRYHEADILTELGDAYDATGNTPTAQEVWRDALAILVDLDAPTDAVRAKLRRVA
jgi:tetratricopeptide (TPR) repeat protein/transcriptional regulator with XRE-family HTH domain